MNNPENKEDVTNENGEETVMTDGQIAETEVGENFEAKTDSEVKAETTDGLLEAEETIERLFQGQKIWGIRVSTWFYIFLGALAGGLLHTIKNHHDEKQKQVMASREVYRNPELQKILKQGTLYLKLLNESGDYNIEQTTAAFAIAEDVIVTARHSVRGGFKVDEIFGINIDENSNEKGWTMPVKGIQHIVVYQPDLDLAVIVFAQPVVKKDNMLPIANNLPEKGDSIATCGHPMGKNWTIYGGAFEGESHMERAPIRYRMLAYPGNSGGPVVNEKGEVFAVMTNMEADSYALGAPTSPEILANMIAYGNSQINKYKKSFMTADETTRERSEREEYRRKNRTRKTKKKNTQGLSEVLRPGGGMGKMDTGSFGRINLNSMAPDSSYMGQDILSPDRAVNRNIKKYKYPKEKR